MFICEPFARESITSLSFGVYLDDVFVWLKVFRFKLVGGSVPIFSRLFRKLSTSTSLNCASLSARLISCLENSPKAFFLPLKSPRRAVMCCSDDEEDPASPPVSLMHEDRFPEDSAGDGILSSHSLGLGIARLLLRAL